MTRPSEGCESNTGSSNIPGAIKTSKGDEFSSNTEEEFPSIRRNKPEYRNRCLTSGSIHGKLKEVKVKGSTHACVTESRSILEGSEIEPCKGQVLTVELAKTRTTVEVTGTKDNRAESQTSRESDSERDESLWI